MNDRIKKAEIEIECWKEEDIFLEYPYSPDAIQVDLSGELRRLKLPDGDYKITLTVEKI